MQQVMTFWDPFSDQRALRVFPIIQFWWYLNRMYLNQFCIQQFVGFCVLDPCFLMTLSESPKIPQNRPFLTWPTFVHQQLFLWSTSQTKKICKDWKWINHRVPRRRSLRNLAFLCLGVCAPKLWKWVKNLIFTPLHKKLYLSIFFRS